MDLEQKVLLKHWRLMLDSIRAVPGATPYDGGLYIQSEGNAFESTAEIADLVCRLDAPAIALYTLHERTKTAIAKATQPYIVPFLLNVIERVQDYVKR